jgi:Xaa-Pro aminopeptidase
MVANPAQNDLREVCERVFESVQDCTKLLNRLRAIKQSAELERMQRAIDLTVEAFKSVRTNLEKSKTENALEAEFIYKFRQKNATHAYEPIVAAGENACTLHYVANDAKINARDLVLIDIGARVDGYAADITRTYCRNPTKRQRAVHAAVERVHDEVISLIEPGLLVADYIRESDLIMKHALNELGLLEDLQDDETFRRYFPHAMSHGLGVDTHDSLGAPRFFEPGMVLTVEPGIYIDEEGIGVRIEDDILVTKTGRKNLSAALSTALYR